MTDHLNKYVDSRDRITVRRGVLSADIVTCAGQLVESIGMSASRNWCRELAIELRAEDTPTEVVVNLAAIPTLVTELESLPTGSDRRASLFASIERATVDAVTALSGRPE